MAKPNKENIITDLLIELEKGISYTECARLNEGKWGLPRNTFLRYWKESNARHLIVQQKIQNALAEYTLKQEKKRLRKAILSKEERMYILTDIATGDITVTKPVVCNGVIQDYITTPNCIDRRGAIAELNKMDGSYSPIRTDLTTNGKDIETKSSIDLTKLSQQTLKEIRGAFSKGNDEVGDL